MNTGLPYRVRETSAGARSRWYEFFHRGLNPEFDALEEAPLPHVYFDDKDITLSPLCLFDPDANEWSHEDLIAETTVPWAADWLACYEGWLASGRWHGGGRHGRPRPME